MIPADLQDRIVTNLSSLKEQALYSFDQGNVAGGYYLAMLCGMWANEWRQPRDKNMFSGDSPLFIWFDDGYQAVIDATHIDDAEKKT